MRVYDAHVYLCIVKLHVTFTVPLCSLFSIIYFGGIEAFFLYMALLH